VDGKKAKGNDDDDNNNCKNIIIYTSDRKRTYAYDTHIGTSAALYMYT